MAYGGIIGQSFDDSVIKEYIDQQINELKQQISETSVKIATGSYVGTGTYGESNPNSLTFDFEPKLVIIGLDVNDSNATIRTATFFCFYLPTDYKTYSYRYTNGGSMYNKETYYAKLDGKTLSWYTSVSVEEQLNFSKTYHYLAIG